MNYMRILKCPHIISRGEGADFCELTEKVSGRIHPCELQSSGKCTVWEEIKIEWAKEAEIDE